AKASLEVLKKDKELMIFPIISGIAMMVVTAAFAIPTLVGNLIDGIFDTGIPFLAYIVLFLFYLVQYIVVYFFSTALVGAAIIRLRGGDPTVKDGFRIAFSRIAPIAGWALVSATVGLVLNMISSKGNKKGSGIRTFISSLFGAAWNIVTFLVVPVLAIEGLGPIKALKRSWELLKKSWGEQIAGTLSIGAVFGLIGVLGGLLLVGLAIGLSIVLESFIPAIIFGVLLIVFIMLVSLISSSLNGIFTAAVYAYAADGQVGLFDENLVRNAVMTQTL
ncbi:MAG: DUF6159 family protein, partial [Anaerolineaceae bacterium]|nr:DUF6159 family protein [Anaerolineaceae bacterium]